jgi:hypothetical protein
MKKELNNKTGNKQHRHSIVECFPKRLNRDRPILPGVKYLCDYGTDNCNSVGLNVSLREINVQMRDFLSSQQAS